MTYVKICGITNLEDAHVAADAGADMLGFIFVSVSQRYISPEDAQPIIQAIHERENAPTCVGVFVVQPGQTPHAIDQACITSGVDAAQIVGLTDPAFMVGLETPAYACVRPEAVELAKPAGQRFERRSLPNHLPTLLLDAFHPRLYGGTGETAPKDVAMMLSEQTARLMLAGGLTPDNVADFVQVVRPWAVDVASGTESGPGKKDPPKVRAFIQTAKGALQ